MCVCVNINNYIVVLGAAVKITVMVAIEDKVIGARRPLWLRQIGLHSGRLSPFGIISVRL